MVNDHNYAKRDIRLNNTRNSSQNQNREEYTLDSRNDKRKVGSTPQTGCQRETEAATKKDMSQAAEQIFTN